jgi:PAS domain S-box-containing protein
MPETPDLIDITPALITMFEPDGHCVRCNQAWRKFTGIHSSESAQTAWLSALHPDDRDSFHHHLQHVLQLRQSCRIQYRLYNHEDCDFHWVDDTLVPFYAEQGALCCVLGTAQDTTASNLLLEAVERALHMRNAEAKRFRTILESASDGIHILSRTGQLIQYSESFRRMLGYSPEEMLHLSVFDWDASLTRQDIEDKLAHTSENIDIFQTRHKRRDGTLLDVEVSSKGIIIENEVYQYASARDITERKQSEERLRRAQELAETSIRIKSEFLATMSHELKTPMNGIIGLLQLAEQEDYIADSLTRDYLHKALQSAEMLLGLIQDVLDFTSLEAGKLTLRMDDFNLADLTDSLRQQFAGAARDKGLIFHLQTLPGENLTVRGDRLRLRQVMTHLISNAIKFTEQGKIEVMIRYDLQPPDNVQLDVSVSDTGIGIMQDVVDRIFLPFTQIDGSVTRKSGGCGLGLSITQRLLAQMDAELNVSTSPGKGSVFAFRLRLQTPQPPAIPTSSTQNRKTSAIHADNVHSILSGKHILVVEDNEINQLVISRMLNLLGARVHMAADGQEALACLQQQAYSAVIMDLHMPNMGGLEATRRIREQLGLTQVPIIALTAGDALEEKEKCLSSGMNAFITKPVKQDKIAQAITELIRQSSQGGE